MRALPFVLLLTAAGCSDGRPPAPTAEDSAQLNAAEAMLDQAGNEDRPEAPAADAATRSTR